MSVSVSKRMIPDLFKQKITHITLKRYLNYVQGQSPEPKIREYFYFIDHQGMVSKCYIFIPIRFNPQYRNIPT